MLLLLLLLLIQFVVVVSLWIDQGDFVSAAWICAAFVNIVKGTEVGGHSTLIHVAQLGPEHVARRRVRAGCGRVAKKVNEKKTTI